MRSHWLRDEPLVVRLSMCQWVAVAFAGDARWNCTWDAIGPLKPGERRSDGHPDIGLPRQTFALANVHAPFLSKAPYTMYWQLSCEELIILFLTAPFFSRESFTKHGVPGQTDPHGAFNLGFGATATSRDDDRLLRGQISSQQCDGKIPIAFFIADVSSNSHLRWCISYDRYPKNPSLQLLQKCSNSASVGS